MLLLESSGVHLPYLLFIDTVLEAEGGLRFQRERGRVDVMTVLLYIAKYVFS